MMSSQGLAIAATAMAVSGTVVLLTLCRQKPPLLISLALDPANTPPHQSLSLRPCIKNSSSSVNGEKRRAPKKRKSKGSGKRVQFSDRVEEFYFPAAEVPKRKSVEAGSCRVRSAQMPANQMALYRGILRDRVHRVPACSY